MTFGADPPHRPEVTVVTVVFNGAAAIARTIESVLCQRGNMDVEYIVVDGASTDGTREIVAGYGDRIRRFVSEPDGGIYDAMNKAIRMAGGEFLLFMNCGDVFLGDGSLASMTEGVESDLEQIVLAGWVRRSHGAADTVCMPSIAHGRFHHQALMYSRSIHDWHGEYVNAPGLTTADYLFFATLLDSGRIEVRSLDRAVSIIDTTGVSAGLQTYSQKVAIDFLRGKSSRCELAATLLLHPMYHRLKRALGSRS